MIYYILGIFLKEKAIGFIDVKKKKDKSVTPGSGTNQLKEWNCHYRDKEDHRNRSNRFSGGKGCLSGDLCDLVQLRHLFDIQVEMLSRQLEYEVQV